MATERRRDFVKRIAVADFVHNLTPHWWASERIANSDTIAAMVARIQSVRTTVSEDELQVITRKGRVFQIALAYNGIISSVTSKAGVCRPADKDFKEWAQSQLVSSLKRSNDMVGHLVTSFDDNRNCTFMVMALWWFPQQPMTLPSFIIVNDRT